MALTKVSRGLLSTGIVDNSNATAITLNADESATFAGAATMDGLTVVGADTALAASIGSAAQRVYITPNGTEIIYNASGNSVGQHVWQTGNTERLRLDEKGGMGLGLAVNAGWTTDPILQVGPFAMSSRATSASSLTSLGQLSTNQYWDGSNHKYIATGNSSIYTQNNGTHIFSGAPSGSAGGNITYVTGMTISATGKVGIGISQALAPLTINNHLASSTAPDHIYVKSADSPHTVNDPSVVAATPDGILVTSNSSNTSGPDKMGLVLYNDNATAAAFSPMLLFAKRETTTPHRATMAGIYAKAPTGNGNNGGWIDGELHFATAGAATGGIKSRFVINKEGHVSITQGNLGFATGHGIDFSAQTATSATNASTTSELLDHYEEGSWTPTMNSGGNLTINKATYTRIGNLVTAYLYVVVNPTQNTTMFNIAGLPFPASPSAYYAGGSLGYAGNLNVSFWLDPLVVHGGTYLYFHRNDTGANVLNNNVPGSTPLIIQLTYTTG